MAAQRACVMFKSSASGLSHGANVWLAAEDTAESLGAAIARVLRDRSLQSRIAAGGYYFARNRHDRRAVAHQLCQAYCRLLLPTRHWRHVAARPPLRMFTEEPASNLWDVGARRPLEIELNASA
jgi:hypothetical protein